MKSIKNIILIITIVLIDFITKLIFIDKFILFTDFFYISTILNTGTISGAFEGLNLLFIFTTVIILCVLIYLYRKENKLRLGLSFIIAGAIGNLISRIIYQGVVDFIYLVPFGTFNLADVIIDIGIIICIYKTMKK